MIGKSFTSAFLVCKSKTLVELLIIFNVFNVLLVDLISLGILTFALVVLKMISVHDGLNIWVSLEVLFYQFVRIFLVDFFDVVVNKCFFLFFESDFDGLLELGQNLFMRFMQSFKVSSKRIIKQLEWLLGGFMEMGVWQFDKFSWQVIIAHCQFYYCKMKNIYATLKYLILTPFNLYYSDSRKAKISCLCDLNQTY